MCIFFAVVGIMFSGRHKGRISGLLKAIEIEKSRENNNIQHE
jgi:hypothetical protein